LSDRFPVYAKLNFNFLFFSICLSPGHRGLWLHLRQLDQCATAERAHLAVHAGLQDPARVQEWNVPDQEVPRHLGDPDERPLRRVERGRHLSVPGPVRAVLPRLGRGVGVAARGFRPFLRAEQGALHDVVPHQLVPDQGARTGLAQVFGLGGDLVSCS
jgi:hypothetical protein